MKHTPGPWIVDEDLWEGGGPSEWKEQNRSVRSSDYKTSICMTQGHSGLPMEANARLIAAAPEMLEQMISTYKTLLYFGSNISKGNMKNIIEKATGQKIEEVLK
jgi:hypothetical protein